MTLTDFYEYIFGDKALIKFDKRIESNEEHKNKILEKREKEIRKAFQFITDTSNPAREKFSTVLSSLQTPGANALKEILYSQEQFSLSENQYDGEKIKLIFQNVNRTFKYFPEEDIQAENDFVAFFRACKLVGDFVECNNDDENTLASDLAYKMLVVFGAAHGNKQHILANVETYLRAHGNKQSQYPIHDALTQAIPINDLPLNDLNGWRKFIQTYGFKALEFFQEAPAIEKLAGNAPVTIEEAAKIASRLVYQRASEYPELALLCKGYHINEDIFDQCLEIEKRRKKSDNLPDVHINGAVINKEYEGYHLVKLPIDDPRAYILGNITNCCQSVGGHSEQCVIDGITLENNGFYVLLKQKRKLNTNTPPLIEGHIDHASYDIVGQGYAWLSKRGNMVFDSWENLRPETDDAIAVPLLEKFAQEVTDKTENILRVMIGTGGKTPSYFSNEDKIVSLPEEMLEGIQYSDSETQGLIYFNESKCITILQQQGLLTDDTLKKLRGSNHFSSLLQSFLCLDKEIQTQQNFDFLVENLEYAIDLAAALSMLHSANPALINNENRQLLGEHAKYSKDIAYILSTLYRADPTLINDENRQLLGAHATHSGGIASALGTLYKANPNLIDDKCLQLLITHAAHSNGIANALITFYKENPYLINDECLQLLFKHAEHANGIGFVFHLADKENPTLTNYENIQLVATHAVPYLEEIFDALRMLDKASRWLELLNDDNFKLLVTHAEHAVDIASNLIKLDGANPLLVNDVTHQLLATHASDANYIGMQILSAFSVASSYAYEVSFNLTRSQHRLFSQNPTSMDKIYKKVEEFLLGDKSISFNKDEITALEKENFQYKYNLVFKSLPVSEALESENRNETHKP